MVEYTTNPLTGRQIQVNGTTFNRLFVEGYDYIDGRLVRRQNAPPIQRRREYINIETGRIVREGSRTYRYLMRHGYHTLWDSINEDNYYIISPDLRLEAELALMEDTPDMSLNNLYRIRQSGIIERIAELEDELEVELVGELARRVAEIRARRNAQDRIEMEREYHAELRRNRRLVQQDNQFGHPVTQSAHDSMMSQLAELNIMLCDDCRMPYNPNELINKLCKECSEE
jgi:hypothetical protein